MSEDKAPSLYKDTILLPKTDFPMKANLAQSEPLRIEAWTKDKIYDRMVNSNTSKGTYTMPDGPPYANGNLHLGHVLNKVLKDMVIKSRNMAGYKAAFVPGWDCHGLPIELNVTKKLGDKRKDMTDAQVRDLCRKEALHWIDIQREQFIRLGILADWQNPYLTLDPAYEADEIRLLAQIQRNGILYRGEKPVYWCPALQTALAAAEVEYRDHKSPAVYVSFELIKSPLSLALPEKTSLVIWTTTPWTLPANHGIALNANFEYGVYSVAGAEGANPGPIIVALDLKEAFEKDTGLTLSLVQTFKGAQLEGSKAKHPFMDRESLIILGDHVTTEAGTGCVHTAPGHGLDDYIVGMKYGLPVDCPVDEAGRFTLEDSELKGIKIWEGNKVIVERLRKMNHLLGFQEITHSYPHNPRTKTPLIFRATPQWFIRYDDPNFPIREKALTAIENDLEFFPGWGSQRLKAMIGNSPDWCLSRQRLWGVPIPVFYCSSCKHEFVDADAMDKVADHMEKSGKGLEAYFSLSVEELIGKQSCEKCGSHEFTKGKDILDVWFDSGACHLAVQRRRKELEYPADIYLEGSDQHRGWFQTSLMSSVAAEGKPPFKALVTHGFVNDAQGAKMSKSQGNVTNPSEVMKTYGAEVLRLWVAHEDYGQDVTVSEEIFKRTSESYRRFRNTFRFLLGNLHDFDVTKEAVAFEKMPPLDQWAMLRLNELVKTCEKAYDRYEFFKVYHALNNFFAVDLSATYLDILKDRLYTWKPNGNARKSSQTVFYHLVESLCGLMAPITSFLSDEVYGFLPHTKTQSIFELGFPKVDAKLENPNLLADFEVLLEVRALVSKELEELRRQKVIGSSLDAQVNLTVSEQKAKTLDRYKQHLREFLIVSQVSYQTSEKTGAEFSMTAGKAEGIKCYRCWHYSLQTGKNSKFPEACEKCVEALS